MLLGERDIDSIEEIIATMYTYSGFVGLLLTKKRFYNLHLADRGQYHGQSGKIKSPKLLRTM